MRKQLKSTEKKDPPTIIVYFDVDRKHKQVIRPTDEFNGDYTTLIRDLFNSFVRLDDGTTVVYRNYHSYEIIEPLKEEAA